MSAPSDRSRNHTPLGSNTASESTIACCVVPPAGVRSVRPQERTEVADAGACKPRERIARAAGMSGRGAEPEPPVPSESMFAPASKRGTGPG